MPWGVKWAIRRVTSGIRAAPMTDETATPPASFAALGLPEPLLRAFDVGESTGQLEAELRRAATDYRDAAVRRIELIVEWLPRVALIAVAVVVAYRIVGYYAKLGSDLKDYMGK